VSGAVRIHQPDQPEPAPSEIERVRCEAIAADHAACRDEGRSIVQAEQQLIADRREASLRFAFRSRELTERRMQFRERRAMVAAAVRRLQQLDAADRRTTRYRARLVKPETQVREAHAD
jgi:hypothetical protein